MLRSLSKYKYKYNTYHLNKRLLSIDLNKKTNNSNSKLSLDQSILDDSFQFTTVPNKIGNVQISKLKNGLRVASVDTSTPVSCVGVVIKCGSRYEPKELQGISQFMEWMSFKSTKYRESNDIVRLLSSHAANMQASSSRETQVLCGEIMPDFSPMVLDIIGDVICNHKYDPVEVDEVRESLKLNLQYPLKDGAQLAHNSLHSAAYMNNTLGLRPEPTLESLNNINSDVLSQWNRQFFTSDNIIIVGIGIKHEELLSAVDDKFSTLSNTTNNNQHEVAKYTGGFQHWFEDSSHDDPFTHVTIGFECDGWSGNDHQNVTAAVLQTILGGGGSFSAGGPGKGMYSKLYTEVLNKYYFVNHIQSLLYQYSDSGIFGIHASCEPQYGEHITAIVCEQLCQMGSVNSDLLSRAKKLLRSNMLMQMESRSVILEDTGMQLLFRDKVSTQKEFSDIIESVTEADIKALANKLVHSKCSMSIIGDATKVPHFEIVNNVFK